MSLEVMSAKLVLVNRLPVLEEAPPLQTESELQRHGLLVAVLALIFMSNGAGVEEGGQTERCRGTRRAP